VIDRPDLLVPFGEINELMGIGKINEIEHSFVSRLRT
jgi:hypothetical protein